MELPKSDYTDMPCCSQLAGWLQHGSQFRCSRRETDRKKNYCVKSLIRKRGRKPGREENASKELGDYDVLCINESKREIWLIESKVFHKVGSVFEDLMLQKSVFVQHRYDEKFQRRIDYIKNNLPKIIRVFNLQGIDYNIIHYIVTNKMFYSRCKQLSFEIISFSELQSMLMCGYKVHFSRRAKWI